jgi:hypothetical protein
VRRSPAGHMADQTHRHDGNDGPSFQVCLNGFLVRECWTELQAVDAALGLMQSAPRSEVTILSLRTGHLVPAPELKIALGGGPGPSTS